MDAGVTVIEGLEPVRRRPEMYLGDVGLHGLHWLVRELLDCAHGLTSFRARVDPQTLWIDTEATPVRTTPRTVGRPPYLIEACTSIAVPIDEPATLRPTEALDESTEVAVFRSIGQSPVAVALANAVSAEFVLSSRAKRTNTTVQFAAGRLVGGPDVAATTAPDGVSLTFSPDPEIFERTTLRFDIVCEIARDVACVRERGPS